MHRHLALNVANHGIINIVLALLHRDCVAMPGCPFKQRSAIGEQDVEFIRFSSVATFLVPDFLNLLAVQNFPGRFSAGLTQEISAISTAHGKILLPIVNLIQNASEIVETVR